MNGNLEQVRNALSGITGVAVLPQVEVVADWYFVVTRMGRELDTVDSLRRNGIRAYWPSFKELLPSRRQPDGILSRRWRRSGIIPGYVFSSVCPDVQQIVGAIDIARTYSGNPLLICEHDLDIIRRIEAGLNTPRDPGKSVHSFKCGQKVRFIDDVIGRWPPGRIVELARDGRISVEVELMGRKVPIWALPHQIEKV